MLNSPECGISPNKYSYVQIVEVEVNRIKEVMQEKKGTIVPWNRDAVV